MEGSAFPVSSEHDVEQVATALDTASALWSRGDAREALRWLRRAAEMAGAVGDDSRAVQLARAAADLSSELQIPPTLVPASAGPIVPRSQPSHPPPAPSYPSHPPSIPPPPESQPAPRSHALSGMRRVPNPAQASARPAAPRRNSEGTDVVKSAQAALYDPGRAAAAAAAASTLPLDRLPRSLTSTPSSRPRQALHVAVLPSDEDRNLLYVRILGEGEPLPPGAHEAVLVALEPTTNLLTRR